MRESDWTRVLGWAGYKVYRAEIDERAKRLKLWVRRKRGNKQLICSGCGQLVNVIAESYEREVRDLPCFEYLTTVVIELYRLRCPGCGVKVEKVPLLPSKAPFIKRFEDAVGLACESAAARRVAQQFGLSTNTVRAIDLRYLQRWSQSRKKQALRNMGVDEIHMGKKQKFITVVSNLDTAEPLWFGQDRKKETLDEFFEKRLSLFQRCAIQAACVDMWDPFRQSIEQWLPGRTLHRYSAMPPLHTRWMWTPSASRSSRSLPRRRKPSWRRSRQRRPYRQRPGKRLEVMNQFGGLLRQTSIFLRPSTHPEGRSGRPDRHDSPARRA